MQKSFEILAQTNGKFVELMDGLSIEQLNKIPSGFSNNILWNYAHLISAQQILSYRLSGLPTIAQEAFIEEFKKGTKPERYFEERELAEFKALCTSTLSKLQEDYENQMFKSYKLYTTGFNVTLTCIEDAIEYLVMHEGFHYGYASSIKKHFNLHRIFCSSIV